MKVNIALSLVCSSSALLKVLKCRPVRRSSVYATRMFQKDRATVEDSDELEYNIAFPINGGTESEDGEFKEPVIYLFGWTGATDKNLAKYSSIYENEGFITVRYISPPNVPFSSAASTILTDTSQKLLQLLDDYELRSHPVFFHVFSNGGGLQYHYAAEAFQKDNVDVVGVIMDSGPSRLELIGGVKAIYYSQKCNGRLYATALCIGFISSVLYRITFGSKDASVDYYKALKESRQNMYPHLFLYSTSDSIVPSNHIEEMADARRKAGAVVKTVNFSDSPHVQHMRFYQKSYTELSLKFLDGCLRIYDGTQDLSNAIDLSSSVDPPGYS